MKPKGVTIQMKAIGQYFHVELIILYKVVLTLVLSHGTVYYTLPGTF